MLNLQHPRWLTSRGTVIPNHSHAGLMVSWHIVLILRGGPGGPMGRPVVASYFDCQSPNPLGYNARLRTLL